jgi:hypothetical protein
MKKLTFIKGSHHYSISRKSLFEAIKDLNDLKSLPRNTEDIVWENVEIFNNPKDYGPHRHYIGTFKVVLKKITSTKEHRLMVVCPVCNKMIPFGRFNQHMMQSQDVEHVSATAQGVE